MPFLVNKAIACLYAKTIDNWQLTIDNCSSVVEAEVCRVVFIRGRIHHPVNHVLAPIIKEWRVKSEEWRIVSVAYAEGLYPFWLQVFVAFVCGWFIKQIREGRHSESSVIAQEHIALGFGRIPHPILHVDAWEEVELTVVAAVMVSHNTHRCRKPLIYYVMLKEETHLRSVTMICATDALITHLYAKGCLS